MGGFGRSGILRLFRLYRPCMSCRKFTTAASSEECFEITFENVLNDENKARVQKKMTSIQPVRTTKEYPLKSDHATAAVLVPMCTVRGEPSLLFTLRSSKLRKHRGQVSFPGGNVDETDRDMIHTALRETEEELGMRASAFDIWGQMNPLPGSAGGKYVYPILARSGEVNVDRLPINHDEVEEAFTISLRHLCHQANVGTTRFRDGPGYTLPVYIGGAHRIWGLTAVIVHQMLNLVAPNLYHFKVRHRKSVHHTHDHSHRSHHSKSSR